MFCKEENKIFSVIFELTQTSWYMEVNRIKPSSSVGVPWLMYQTITPPFMRHLIIFFTLYDEAAERGVSW
jgi:hypothetical protein